MEGGWGEGANERSEKDEKEIERDGKGREDRYRGRREGVSGKGNK